GVAPDAAAPDPTQAIVEALVGALGSEHADLRLRAAVALARHGDPLGIDVLGAFLRSDEHAFAALDALVGLAGRASGAPGGADAAGAATELIAARLDAAIAGGDADGGSHPDPLIEALGAIGHPLGATSLVRLVVHIPAGKERHIELVVDTVLEAVGAILRDRGARPRVLPDGRSRQRLRDELALAQLGELVRSPLPVVRRWTAAALGDVDARGAEDLLARLSADRDPEVRVAAVEALALRAEYVPGATLGGLESALRGGRRELVLPAALGLAARKRPEAFQPLLLVARAGEPAERERAIVALGSLGDRRALDHLLPLLDPDPDDEASRALTPAAAEALGRLLPALSGDEAADLRARLVRLATSATGALRLRALTGLRHAGELAVVLGAATDRELGRDVRVHAVEQLGLAAAAATEPALAELLSDDDDAVREAALAALSKVLGGDRTRVNLHALVARHDPISRPAAAYLATAGDPATLVARLGGVQSPDVRRTLREGVIRRAALPRPELQAALEAEDPVPRAEAAWIAGAAGDAARPLAGAVEAAVARGAARRMPAAGPALGPAQLAEHEALRAGLWAARRVGAAGAVAVEAAAHTLLGDDRAAATLRREAAAVLAAAGSGPAVVALTRAIGDTDREVRATAAAALAARAPSGAAGAVRSLGSRADATTIAPLALVVWPELARELIDEPSTRAWSLAVSLSGDRLDELIALATSKGSAGRLAAIAALGRLGGDRAKQTLQAIHGDAGEPDAVRLAAWKALQRIRHRGRKTYAEGQDKGPSSASLGMGAGSSDEDDDGDDEDGDDEDGDGEDGDGEDGGGDGDDDGGDEDSDDEDGEDEDDDSDEDEDDDD
ncbi:MAG TPA: HEAT repeat domain-containing protein, partial [Kofleriaceae bacterium]|nr:HEAT repeat domain-containing protein [Kofleriaceae bacterium]